MLSATVAAPGHSKVVPLTPEFIAPKDGADKQDRERNAVRRWSAKHGARPASLRPVFLGDDLLACPPVAKMVPDVGDDFIFTCKPASHKALTTLSTAPNLTVTKRKFLGERHSAIAGSSRFSCATARMRSRSTGSASRLSTQRARSNIPWPG
jgi:hypothetical protein